MTDAGPAPPASQSDALGTANPRVALASPPASPITENRDTANLIPTSTDNMPIPNKAAAVAEMKAMANKYVQDFPRHVPSQPAPTHDTILLTGATGALGGTLLSLLVPLPEVARIYVVNRRSPTGVPLLKRQTDALEQAGFDAASLMQSKKIVLIETNLPDHHLGLPEDLYEEVSTPN